MDNNYEDIVRNCYNQYQKKFIKILATKYPSLTLFDAENLYQDTFLAIRENVLLGRIKENTSWSSYIMTIGLNLASKEMRKLGKTGLRRKSPWAEPNQIWSISDT
jgi:DNA-directed RNA polymerase specialized sigma24 family protein